MSGMRASLTPFREKRRLMRFVDEGSSLGSFMRLPG